MYGRPARSAAPGSTVTSTSAAARPLHGEHREVRVPVTTSTPSGAAARSSSATAAAFAAFGTSSSSSGLDEVGDEVVDDAAVVRAAQRVLGVAGRDPAQVRREAPVDERRRPRPGDRQLAEVAHVEDPDGRAHRRVLGDGPAG